MSRKAFLILLKFFLSAGLGMTQTISDTHLIILKDTFCVSYGAPILVKKGATVKVECDTAYIINKLRFNAYEAAKSSLLKNGTNRNWKALEEKYEMALKQQESYYKGLMRNYSSADSLSSHLLTDIREDLQSLAGSMENTKKLLDSADKKLEEVLKLLHEERKALLRKQILAGFGGLGLGILIGALVH